jgi:hypothetical protein
MSSKLKSCPIAAATLTDELSKGALAMIAATTRHRRLKFDSRLAYAAGFVALIAFLSGCNAWRDGGDAAFNPEDMDETIRWMEGIGKPVKAAQDARNQVLIEDATKAANAQFAGIAGKAVRWTGKVHSADRDNVIIEWQSKADMAIFIEDQKPAGARPYISSNAGRLDIPLKGADARDYVKGSECTFTAQVFGCQIGVDGSPVLLLKNAKVVK